MAKTQIWLRDDERDLVYRALRYVVDCASGERAGSPIERFALDLARDRLRDVAEHFAPLAHP